MKMDSESECEKDCNSAKYKILWHDFETSFIRI